MWAGRRYAALFYRTRGPIILADCWMTRSCLRQRSHVMMMQGCCDAGGMVAQAPFQRTALQLVHRHDHVELVHGCVMTRACSRQRRVVYGKLFWTVCTTGETSHALPCGTTSSAATVVRPDALPSAQARKSFQIALFAFGGS